MRKSFNYDDYIGKTFGYLTITGISPAPMSVICKCKCGEQNIERKLYRLLKTKTGVSSCGKCFKGIPYKTFIDKTFGYLTIMSFKSEGTGVKAICKCKCGNTVVRRFSDSFLNKKENYCEKCWKGIPLDSLLGKKIGTFTVMSKVNTTNSSGKTTQFILKCECGNEIIRKAKDIIENKRNQCKCNNCYNGIVYQDLIGKTYNNLTIINILDSGVQRADGRIENRKKILLKCKCGNTIERNLNFLNSQQHLKNCSYCYNGIFYKNYIGKTYGLLTIQDVIKEKHCLYALCKCKCGNNVKRRLDELNDNSECRACYHGVQYKSYIGKKYGFLTIEDITKGERGRIKVKCRCKCGQTTYRYLGELERQKLNGIGEKNTCGFCYNGIPIKDFIGKTYGYLTILKPSDNKNLYKCDCVCKCKPNVIIKKGFSGMLNGTDVSCGCFKNKYHLIKKIKYGYLKILKPSRNTEGGIRYICKCDCGNEIEVLESDLFTGKVTCCNECKENL